MWDQISRRLKEDAERYRVSRTRIIRLLAPLSGYAESTLYDILIRRRFPKKPPPPALIRYLEKGLEGLRWV